MKKGFYKPGRLLFLFWFQRICVHFQGIHKCNQMLYSQTNLELWSWSCELDGGKGSPVIKRYFNFNIQMENTFSTNRTYSSLFVSDFQPIHSYVDQNSLFVFSGCLDGSLELKQGILAHSVTPSLLQINPMHVNNIFYILYPFEKKLIHYVPFVK